MNFRLYGLSTNDMACIFCKIAKKEIPKEFIYESKDVLGFKDIKPSAPVHYLFIPTEHIESIVSLEKKHAKILTSLVLSSKEVAEKLKLKGYKLVFNVGREGGQVIDHLHLHLLGGWNQKKDIDALPNLMLDK